jgi:hypothetical protein
LPKFWDSISTRLNSPILEIQFRENMQTELQRFTKI